MSLVAARAAHPPARRLLGWGGVKSLSSDKNAARKETRLSRVGALDRRPGGSRLPRRTCGGDPSFGGVLYPSPLALAVLSFT